jgi:predicted O-methyltransferase YrrM
MSKMVDQPEEYFRNLIPIRDELMIELEIEKQDYVKVLPDCQRLHTTGGLLVADNVGFKDADEFNRTIAELEAWRSVPLFSFLPLHSPEKDALCLALRC